MDNFKIYLKTLLHIVYDLFTYHKSRYKSIFREKNKFKYKKIV